MAKKANGETISVRLDPRLKYMCDMAARAQRRTLSSFVEWALQQALNKFEEDNFSVDELWAVDEAERMIKLGTLAPQLLTFEEQKIWKIITDRIIFWETYSDNPRPNRRIIKGVWDNIVKASKDDAESIEFLDRLTLDKFESYISEKNIAQVTKLNEELEQLLNEYTQLEQRIAVYKYQLEKEKENSEKIKKINDKLRKTKILAQELREKLQLLTITRSQLVHRFSDLSEKDKS